LWQFWIEYDREPATSVADFNQQDGVNLFVFAHPIVQYVYFCLYNPALVMQNKITIDWLIDYIAFIHCVRENRSFHRVHILPALVITGGPVLLLLLLLLLLVTVFILP